MLGSKVGYIEILDYRTSEKEKVNSQKSEYMPLRPSSAGACSRKLAHDLMEYRGFIKYDNKEEKTPEVVRLLSLGHSIEWNLLRQFEQVDDFKLRYKQQVLSFFKLPETGELIEGSIDAVIVSEKYKCVIDVKSKKEKFSAFYRDDWEEWNERFSKMASVETFGNSCFWIPDLSKFLTELNDPFLSDNFYQLNMYFFDEGDFLQSRGVDHAAIVQYSKNTSRLRELRFKPSKKIYETIKTKYLAVSEAVDKFKDPTKVDKDYSLGSIKCAFCPHKTLCWPEADALKEYFSTWPKKKWPTDSLKISKEIEPIYEAYKTAIAEGKKADFLEEQLIAELEYSKIQKVKFQDGHIYELKMLKSPKPHLELRRTKL